MAQLVNSSQNGQEREMRFILQGFTQDTGFRVFKFEGIAADQTRTGFVVETDLALTRRYGIRLQELPLLCRELLERRDEAEQARTFIFTEAEMVMHKSSQAAERQVLRAKERVKLSEPDLRTEAQTKAAREASRPAGGRSSGGNAHISAPSFRNNFGPGIGSAAKTDV
jgi:hypothetical protein